MDANAPGLLKPTLIAGAVFGVAAGLPIVGLLNVCCCALVIGCGFFGAFLYSRECRGQGVEFRPGNGAWVGLISGAFYAVAATVTSGIVQLVTGQTITAALEKMEEMGSVPPEMIDKIRGFVESAGSFGIVVLGFFVTLLLAAIFSTIGGLIGGAVFKVELPPPAPPGGADMGGSPPPPVG